MATTRKRKALLKRKLRRANEARHRKTDAAPEPAPTRTFHKTKKGASAEAAQYAAISASYNRRRR